MVFQPSYESYFKWSQGNMPTPSDLAIADVFVLTHEDAYHDECKVTYPVEGDVEVARQYVHDWIGNQKVAWTVHTNTTGVYFYIGSESQKSCCIIS